MRIEFTEYVESGSEYNANNEFAGFVTVTAEGLADTKRIVDYFKLCDGDEPTQLIERAKLLQNPDLVHVHRPKKRHYYEVSGSLDVALFHPYTDWARRVLGFDGRFPDLDITPNRDGLKYTHLTQSLRVEVGETVCYTCFTQAEHWNGRTPQENAERAVNRYIAEEFGHVEPIREFIECRNGQYKRNPDYATGKRNPVQPRLVHTGLCAAFVQWWIANEANAAQLEIIAKNRELAETTGKYSLVDWMKGYDGIRYLDPAGNCDYDGKGLMTSRMSFEEFAAL